MVPYFERFIAFRYLGSKRKEGLISVIAWFSLIGIALGVATLIIVMSVMNGFRAELLTRILGLNGHITVYDRQAPIKDFNQLALRIGEIPSVLYVTPQIQGQAMIMIDGKATGVLIRGLDPLIMQNKSLISKNIVAGKLKEFGSGADVVIGKRLADRIGVTAGDKVLLISPTSSTTAFGNMPRIKAFKVAAVFIVGMFEYDSTFAYLPLRQAQLFFKSGNSVNALEIEIKDPKFQYGIIDPLEPYIDCKLNEDKNLLKSFFILDGLGFSGKIIIKLPKGSIRKKLFVINNIIKKYTPKFNKTFL